MLDNPSRKYSEIGGGNRAQIRSTGEIWPKKQLVRQNLRALSKRYLSTRLGNHDGSDFPATLYPK